MLYYNGHHVSFGMFYNIRTCHRHSFGPIHEEWDETELGKRLQTKCTILLNVYK